jgi:hypothetical protein
LNWAAVGTSTTFDTDDFAADRVFLVESRSGSEQARASRLWLLQKSWTSSRRNGDDSGCAHGVLAGVTQEKGGKVDHVNNSAVGDSGRRAGEAEAAHHE